MSDSKSVPPELREWIISVTGADDIEVKRVTGGASREAWFVEAVTGDTTVPLFLRYDRRVPKPGSVFHTLQVEAEILTALHAHGVAVPEVVAVHPEQQATLLERISGATWFRLIKDEDEQVSVAKDFIEKLAAMHRIDPRDLGIAALGEVRTVGEHVRDEIAAMRKRVARRDEPAPLLNFCLDWLERNVPEYDGPVVLVQGDTGPGNFMYENGKVTAIVDMELAHYGDPMDDIAWLSLRTVQDTFTHFPSRLAEYERLSGHKLDERRIWYYRLLAETRLATNNNAGIDARVAPVVGSPDAGSALIFGMLHRRLLIEALAHVVGIEAERMDFESDAPDSPYSSTYDTTLGVLEHVAARAGDALAVQWTKGAARLVKFLREVDRRGAALDAQELAELAELLGAEPATVDAGRAALAGLVEAGELDELDYVAQIWRGIQRDNYLMRTASGALYDRTWPCLN
ncbi:phosphotransferase family protein [Nocardia arizonensis]|uniref:phosphotransferase family protein n=1 Tax=Nocardia arizonensis TaxID=1141647 RepID=UPI0006D19C9A|nr:phosphotransferase family protein [Nocardia arizonensis]